MLMNDICINTVSIELSSTATASKESIKMKLSVTFSSS